MSPRTWLNSVLCRTKPLDLGGLDSPPTSTLSNKVVYWLPRFQLTRGTVLVKLGTNKENDWMVADEDTLSRASPIFRAVFSKRWSDTTGAEIDLHPRTGKRSLFKSISMNPAEGTYFLEGRIPPEIFSFEGNLLQDTDMVEGWPKSDLAEQQESCYTAAGVTKRAFRIIVCMMYGMTFSCEQIAGHRLSEDIGRKEDYDGTYRYDKFLFRNVVTICANVEYLVCLDSIGPKLMAALRSSPVFWEAVARHPLKHLMFASKVKDKEVYFDALRHCIAQAYYGVDGRRIAESYYNMDGVTLQSVADVTGTSVEALENYYYPQLDTLAEGAQVLQGELQRLQLHVSRCNQELDFDCSWTTYTEMAYTGEPRTQGQSSRDLRALVVKSIWGQWLAYKTYGYHDIYDEVNCPDDIPSG
jgi:hypothetical protein